MVAFRLIISLGLIFWKILPTHSWFTFSYFCSHRLHVMGCSVGWCDMRGGAYSLQHIKCSIVLPIWLLSMSDWAVSVSVCQKNLQCWGSLWGADSPRWSGCPLGGSQWSKLRKIKGWTSVRVRGKKHLLEGWTRRKHDVGCVMAHPGALFVFNTSYDRTK